MIREANVRSGSASLQVPYLLSLALLVTTFLPEFSPSPKATFRLLRKLDRAFASLLVGRDVDTGEQLPGFERGRGVTGTDKVRLKGIVDRTRIAVTDAMSAGDAASDDDLDAEDTENESMQDADVLDVDEEGDWDMEVARVYDRTVVELGDMLSAEPIGIITDD